MDFVRSFDRTVISIIEKLPGWVQPIMVGASFIGAPLSTACILLFLMGVAYTQKHTRLFVAELIILAALPLAGLLKVLTHRDRPETLYVENMMFKTYSFPSGHAYASFIVFGFLIFLCLKYVADPLKWPLAIMLAGFIVLVGVSRIYLGAHFPSDVLAGWLLGAAVLLLVLKFVIKL